MKRSHIQDTAIEGELPIQTRLETRAVIEATISGIVRTDTTLLRTKVRRNDLTVAITIAIEGIMNAAGVGQETALTEASMIEERLSSITDLDLALHATRRKATNIILPAEEGPNRQSHEQDVIA